MGSKSLWPCKLVGWVAAILGLSMVITGAAHLLAVISAALAQDKPYDFRFVSLIATGGIIIYVGLLNLGVSKWLGQSKGWAFSMSAFGTAAYLVYLVLLLFLKASPDSTDPFAASGAASRYSTMIMGSYFGLLVAVWIWVRGKSRAEGIARPP